MRPDPDPAADGAPPAPLTVFPLTGLGEVRAGDDLAELLAPALIAAGVRADDVLCVSTKIVSKAAGLRTTPADRDEAVARAAVRTVARRRHTERVTAVVQIPSGPVMAAAGVDGSNAPEGPLLLPEDPDACARELRTALGARLGVSPGVLLTDTSSRVWRVGVGDLALGAAGVRSLEDLRGGTDDQGRMLSVTRRALADELAAAADLVKGKTARVPAALVRGLPGVVVPGDGVPARDLSRAAEEDWFRRPSLESVWQALGLPLAEEPVARMSVEPDAERIDRALAVAARGRPGTGDGTAALERPDAATVHVRPGSDAPRDWAAAGALAERVRTALGAESIGRPLSPITVAVLPPSGRGEPAPSSPTDPEEPRR